MAVLLGLLFAAGGMPAAREGPFLGIFTEIGLSRHFSLVVELNDTSQGGKKDGMQLITNVPSGLPANMDLYADFKNETIMDDIELPAQYPAGKMRSPQ